MITNQVKLRHAAEATGLKLLWSFFDRAINGVLFELAERIVDVCPHRRLRN